MPKKQETASGCRPSLPEVAVTLQEDSSITGKIKLSVEEENALLRDRNRQLEAENAIFREGFTRLYGAITRAYATRGKAEKRDVDHFARVVEGLQPQQRPVYLASMGEDMVKALAEAPTLAREEGEGRFTYSTRTRTENRALALVEHVKTTGKASIKSTEARAVLETHEGKPLDRKVVLRALEAAQGLLRATSDKLGGVTRLILSTSTRRPAPASPPQARESHNRIGEGGGGGLSRPRRWAVPWDGED
jgi:hypothetical protein